MRQDCLVDVCQVGFCLIVCCSQFWGPCEAISEILASCRLVEWIHIERQVGEVGNQGLIQALPRVNRLHGGQIFYIHITNVSDDVLGWHDVSVLDTEPVHLGILHKDTHLLCSHLKVVHVQLAQDPVPVPKYFIYRIPTNLDVINLIPRKGVLIFKYPQSLFSTGSWK